MTEEILEEIPFVTRDHRQMFLDGKPFYPMIYEEAVVPPLGFNSVLIRLAAGAHDNLSWNEEMDLAKLLIGKGYTILWELDFDWQRVNFTDKQTLLSLQIACKEFSKVFKEFEKSSLGVLLFKGEVSQFCVDTLANYLTLLAPSLPDLLPIFIALEGKEISEVDLLDLLHKDRFEHFVLLFKGTLPISALAWQKGSSSLGYLGKGSPIPYEEKRAGLLYSSNKEEMEKVIGDLQKKGIGYSVLYENFATEEWDGLDLLITVEEEPSIKVQRILKGFEAAGGKVIRGRGI